MNRPTLIQLSDGSYIDASRVINIVPCQIQVWPENWSSTDEPVFVNGSSILMDGGDSATVFETKQHPDAVASLIINVTENR